MRTVRRNAADIQTTIAIVRTSICVTIETIEKTSGCANIASLESDKVTCNTTLDMVLELLLFKLCLCCTL